MNTKLIGVLSRFGCRKVPKLHTLRDVLVRVARYEFMVMPLAAISYINDGVPQCHSEFGLLQQFVICTNSNPKYEVEVSDNNSAPGNPYSQDY